MLTKLIANIGLALIFLSIAPAAHARTAPNAQPIFDRHTGNYSYEPAAVVKVARRTAPKAKRGKQHYRERPAIPANYAARKAAPEPVSRETQIVAHPEGCPSRAFCGCGVSLHVFGKAVREGGLAIAAEWLRFPRAEPAPGMVAARPGHVFAIMENLGGGRVLAYDPNSGGHRTRIHVRSLAGYTVVNPGAGSRYAQAP